jgi:hypothetical protein
MPSEFRLPQYLLNLETLYVKVVLLWNIIVLCYFEYLEIFIATKGPARPSYYVPARLVSDSQIVRRRPVVLARLFLYTSILVKPGRNTTVEPGL